MPKYPQIISIDFDGTIVELMKALQQCGYKLVLNTCREDREGVQSYLTEAIEFCEKRGIVFRSHNENHPADDFRGGDKARKVFANIYIDDRNIGGFPGWWVVAELLLGNEEVSRIMESAKLQKKEVTGDKG